MKIAIFCPNWVGDMVMATPALRSVRRQYPQAEIVAVLRPYVSDVLAGLDLVDRVLWHSPGKRKSAAPATSGWRFARQREHWPWLATFINSVKVRLIEIVVTGDSVHLTTRKVFFRPSILEKLDDCLHVRCLNWP